MISVLYPILLFTGIKNAKNSVNELKNITIEQKIGPQIAELL
jgi:hypothetical protein